MIVFRLVVVSVALLLAGLECCADKVLAGSIGGRAGYIGVVRPAPSAVVSPGCRCVRTFQVWRPCASTS